MTTRYGKKGEDAWTADLANELQKRGLSSTPFPIFHMFEAGRRTTTKPDIEIIDGGVSVGSAKLGEEKLLAALSTAQEYAVRVASAEELRDRTLHEVFAITYPSQKSEPFHLYALARPGRSAVKSFVFETLPELAASIESILKGEEDKLREEPITEAAPKLLYYSARELARCIRGVRQEELETVFGGHHFFDAVLATALKGKEKGDALRLGAAFLFVNQAFFYVLLSEAAKAGGHPEEYPPIAEEDMVSPHQLYDNYYRRVRKKDYEPIYGIRLDPFFKGKAVAEACRHTIRAIVALAPRIDKRDLAGQVFQTLIPFSIRKPLGAHYTNPRAAELLANLAVEKKTDKVIDPACGSGTLLVASYHRKMELAGEQNETLHRQYVEHDITGIDAMAFAAHLAAVNLALQQPLLETEHVRIATTDSTRLMPGNVVQPTEEVLPEGLRDTTLDFDFSAPRNRRKKGPIQLREGAARSFSVDKVDVVIMNPPFTSWYNMRPDYRDSLKRRFIEYSRSSADILAGKPSQQAFFILLADRFIRSGGRMAAVLPLTTFTARAFHALTEFVLRNYTITHLVVGLGRASFSEDTSFTECLVVARKVPPTKDSKFRLIGTVKPPDQWTPAMIDIMTKQGGEYAIVREFPQAMLLPNSETLWGLLLKLHNRYDESRNTLESVLGNAKINLVSIRELIDNLNLDMRRPMLAGEHLYKIGQKAVLACRDETRAVKGVDVLVLEELTKDMVVFRDRLSGKLFEFPRGDVRPALRRFSLLTQLDVTDETDFGVAKPGSAMERTMAAFYTKNEGDRFLKFLRQKNRLQKLVESGSARLTLARRIDLSAPGTTLLCCWSKEPLMLAANGFIVSGFKDDMKEKLFCLWMNSSIGLSLLLSKATVTRGSWIYMDKFMIDRLPIPDMNRLSGEDWALVGDLWKAVSHIRLVSLFDQLRTDNSFRSKLDDGILRLLGVLKDDDRAKIAAIVRTGVLEAILALKQTMEPVEATEEAEDKDE